MPDIVRIVRDPVLQGKWNVFPSGEKYKSPQMNKINPLWAAYEGPLVLPRTVSPTQEVPDFPVPLFATKRIDFSPPAAWRQVRTVHPDFIHLRRIVAEGVRLHAAEGRKLSPLQTHFLPCTRARVWGEGFVPGCG